MRTDLLCLLAFAVLAALPLAAGEDKPAPPRPPPVVSPEIKADGSVTFRIKAPKASRGPWDYYEITRTVPAAEAFRSLADSKCPLK